MTGKGKVTQQEIDELKFQNPGVALLKFAWPTSGDEIVFKTVNSSDYKYILDMITAHKQAGRSSAPVDDTHQAIFDRCVLWPRLTLEEKMSLPVGVIPSASKIIQERSGFLDVDIMDRILAPDVHSKLIQAFPHWKDITEEEVTVLKASTKFPLFKVAVETCTFVLRPMTRTDVRVSSQAIDDRLSLTKSVTVWPTDVPWDEVPAGWIEALGRAASDLSGWDTEAIVTEL